MARPKTITEETKNINFRAEVSIVKMLKSVAGFKEESEVDTFRRLIMREYEKIETIKKRQRARGK